MKLRPIKVFAMGTDTNFPFVKVIVHWYIYEAWGGQDWLISSFMRIGNSKYWLFQIGGWGLFALINIFFAYSFERMGDAESRMIIFSRLGIFVMLGILFTHLMRFAIIRLNTLQKPVEKQVLQFFLVSVFFAFITSTFYMEACKLPLIKLTDGQHINLLNESEKKFINRPFLLILSGAFYFFINIIIWNLIYFIYHYVTKSRKQQLDTLQLEALVKELELKTIKAHINPHFIFNSLNSIRALVAENPERAREAVTELSNILRSSMQADKSETVTFERELDIVKDYLALENMRFEDRLKIEYNIDEDTLDQPVPPMMLQTLVENAIKHGISKQISGGMVRVISDFKDDYHELAVQNTGQLNSLMNGEGFGLSSTANRLNLLYGDKAKFEIKQVTPSLVEARLLLPIDKN
ncbi:MAG TPA: histidine kinase [Chitinophagaceae bacterium]|nr:histidine kinase [Chitinophagaceae bacterium]